MREIVRCFIWWAVFAAGTTAYAQPPCDVAAAHGIKGCQSQRVLLYAGDWQSQSRIASEAFALDPARLYWACCATDSMGNPSDALQRRAYLVVLPDQRYSEATTIENCAAAIDAGVDQRAAEGGDSVWAHERRAQAMIVGWSDPASANQTTLCHEPTVQLSSAKKEVGAVTIVSVPANAIPNGK